MKRKLIKVLFLSMLILASVGLLACDDNNSVEHEHTVIYHARVEASCKENGNIEYWSCSTCQKKFADETASEEISETIILAVHVGGSEMRDYKAPTVDDTGYTGDTYCLGCNEKLSSGKVLNKLDHVHSMQKTDRREPSCYINGNAEYFACLICNKFYKDIEGIWELTSDDIVIKASHKLNYISIKNATCKEEGVVAHYNCTACNKNFSDTNGENELSSLKIEKLPHTQKTSFIGYEDQNKTICEDGGFLIATCSVCEEFISSSPVAPLGHKSNKWQKYVNPTLNGEGSLKADVCLECGIPNVTKIIPHLNSANYVKELTKQKTKCTDTEEYTYTLTLDGQAISYIYETEQGKHVLKYVNNEPIYIDYNTIYDFDDEFFKKFGNVNYTCADSGFNVMCYCKACNGSVMLTAKMPHDFAYSVKYDGDYAIFTGNCKYASEHQNEEPIVYIVPISDLTVDERSKPSCTSEGEIAYSWTDSLGYHSIEVNSVKLPHTLDGVEMDLKKVYDWNEWSTKLSSFGNVPQSCSAGDFSVKFECDYCTTEYLVSAYIPHKLPTDPNSSTSENEAANEILPKCGVSGSRSYVCAEKSCGEQVDEIIPALTHEYIFNVSYSNENTIILGSCRHGDNHEDEATKTVLYSIPTDKLTVEVKREKTCLQEGITTFIWSDSSGLHSLNANLGKYMHKLNGVDMDLDKIYTVPTTGITLFGNMTLLCNSSTPGQGKFTCDDCDLEFLIHVIGKHTPPSGYVSPTIPCNGTAQTSSFTCTYCHNNVTETTQPAKHTYVCDFDSIVIPSENTGLLNVKCTACGHVKDVIVLPELSSPLYSKEVITTASCKTVGVTKYSYTHSGYGVITFNVTVSKTEHSYVGDPIVWESNGYRYTGRKCANEDNNVIIISVEPIS